MSRCAAMLRALALGCACHLATGCSKDPGAHDIRAVARSADSAASAASPTCDRHVLAPEDFAGILRAPITLAEAVPGDAQSCEFKTAGFPAITVSLRPGLGRTTVEAWASGKMPLPSSPLAGVGEAAVWQEALHEVIAQKNALLCDIQVRAGGGDLAIASSALPAALGALCNRIFAAS